MSVFLEGNHLFLRNPAGGVEDVDRMKQAGFTAIFCNIGDHAPEDWYVIRERAASLRIACGPWLRTTAPDGSFSPDKVVHLLDTAELWDSPLIVNSENELKASSNEITVWLASMCYDRDWALSMECWPFADVDWTPISLVLPQIFPQDSPTAVDAAGCISEWHRVGVPCVVPTYGSYHEWNPDSFDRRTPYGVYTADDCGQDYAAWSAVGETMRCKEEEPDVPEWWEKGYPGGPMVVVKGFPRPLYPPDAAKQGKTPSADGPDVEAYKRTVSRAGRWPWQTFDDAFSNGFSHGKSGNVADSGIAGIQRQQHLDATGWVGEKTFNTLRSIRIPDGLPHAGEMAMDATAVKLVNQAWDRFKGSEPPPGASSLRKKALSKAVAEIGYSESPAGSNNSKYGDWYGMNYQPWCAFFVSWCYEKAGGSPSFAPGIHYSYCPYIVADARGKKNGLATTDDPIPGDLVVYDWEGNGEYDHVGLFERWTQGTSSFDAIEGNTSTSSNSNGGQVMRRARNRGHQPTVFVRVKE